MASIFNNFFTNVGPSLVRKLSRSKTSFKQWLSMAGTKFSFRPISEFTVFDSIYQLNCSKSIGFKDPSIKHVQCIAESIHRPLTYLFNTSIVGGKFPDKMKIAKVIPLFKGGNKSIVSNYRPISLLSGFSKMLEKIVSNQLIHYLEDNKFLYNYQFGFRKKRGTSFSVVDFISKINQAIDNGEVSVGIFLDLSKTFDTVDHEILLEKLFYYGINCIEHNWFKSYLSNTKQFVCLNDCSSDLLPINCGVPQGSILGPILFLLYVNDAQVIMKSIHLVMHADDMNLLHKNKDVKTLISELGAELSSLDDWLLANHLSCNLEKTKFLIFASKKKLKTLQNIPNTICFSGGNLIKRATCTKFLGVKIDQHLNWDLHIEDLSRKIAKSVGIIFKSRYFLPTNVMTSLYYSFVYPYISYCTLTCGSNYQTKLKPIHILQKRVVRAILFADNRTPSKPLFSKLNILTIYEIT